MIKNNTLINSFNTETIYKTILILLVGFILFKFLTYEHYPVHDEIVSVTLLTSFKTSLIKFGSHNHFLTTQIGNLIIFIFGVDIIKIRLISLISFFLILFLIQKHFKDYSKTFIFILIYLSIDYVISYFSLYRGYAFSSLLFTLIFFLIDFKKNNLENSKLLYFILALLFFHNESSIYLTLPILIVLNLQYLKKINKFNVSAYKNFFLFFLIPFFSLFILFCLTEGMVALKIFISSSNFIDIVLIIFNNFFEIIYSGFLQLSSNTAHNVTLFSNLNLFLTYVIKDPYFFSIFGISLLKSIYYIFFKKDKDLIHIIIFIFFITFLLINKNGPTRIYTGFICFFIIYILRDLNLDLFKNKIFNFKILFNITLLIIIFIKLNNVDFVRIKDEKEKYIFFEKNLVDCNFPTKIHLEEFSKHLEYFVYLQKCKKKPDINKFYIYYKS